MALSGREEVAHVLIVDDDPDIREILAEILGVEGYVVRSAGGGQEAVEYLQRCPAPCLVLLDLMMPGVNGWDVLARTRQDPLLAALPVVIMSGASAAHREGLGEVAGTLDKPITFDRLLEMVAAFCGPARHAPPDADGQGLMADGPR